MKTVWITSLDPLWSFNTAMIFIWSWANNVTADIVCAVTFFKRKIFTSSSKNSLVLKHWHSLSTHKCGVEWMFTE